MTNKLLLMSVGVAALVAQAPALAQEATAQPSPDPGLASQYSGGDIIVTAQRREQRLQDVPLAVSALGEEQLRNQGINSIADLGTGKIAGLSVFSVFGVETAMAVNIRGFGPNDPAQGTIELPVNLYIDGVPFARAQGVGLDLITPERIEVLRGPQGQLFGRNAEAGAVQIVSRRPSGELGGEVTTGVGNFGLFTAKGRIDLPEFGGFKVQLSGNFRRRGGYYHNVRNEILQDIVPWVLNPEASFEFKRGDYDVDSQYLRTYGGRAAVEYEAGPFNAYYSFDYTKAKDNQAGLFYQRSDKFGTIFNPGTTLEPICTATTNGTFCQNHLGDKVPGSAPFTVLAMPFYTTAHGHMLNLTYEASDALTIRSITGSRYVRREGAGMSPLPVNPIFPTAFEFMRSRTFSQELQAILNIDRFNLTAGAIYFNEKIKDERESGFAANCRPAGGGLPASPCNPTGSPVGPVWNLGLANAGFKRSFSETNAYGLYAQGTYTPPIFGDRLDITAGLRYSNDTKKGLRAIDFGLCPTAATANCADIGVPLRPGTTDRLRNRYHTSRVDPAFSLKYKVSDDINVYARYAVGYRDGGSSVRSPVFSAFGAEELVSWEAGIKAELFDRRVRFNAAAFHNTIKDELLSLQISPTLNPSLSDFFNSPVDRKIKGFEIETSARLFGGLTLSGTYTYLDANTYLVGLDAVVAGQPVSVFVPSGTIDAQGFHPDLATRTGHPNSTVILAGAQAAPKHSGSVAVDYEVLTNTGRLALRGEWIRSTAQLVGSPQIYQTNIVTTGGVTTATPQPRYNPGITTNRFNASLSFRDRLVGDTEAEIRLWMKNIFNNADESFVFPAGPNVITSLQGPRTFGADFSIRF